MIIRPTLKLAKKLHEPDLSAALGPARDPLLDWHAALFVANRYQYMLVMNTFSLFSVILPGSGIVDLGSFLDEVLAGIRNTMAHSGLFLYPSRIAPNTDRVSICKTLGPSPLASLSDMAWHAMRYLIAHDKSPLEASILLNDIPRGPLKYRTPLEFTQEMAQLPIK